jgi:hypothetical protein
VVVGADAPHGGDVNRDGHLAHHSVVLVAAEYPLVPVRVFGLDVAGEDDLPPLDGQPADALLYLKPLPPVLGAGAVDDDERRAAAQEYLRVGRAY